jgi:hypothetical protein
MAMRSGNGADAYIILKAFTCDFERNKRAENV